MGPSPHWVLPPQRVPRTSLAPTHQTPAPAPSQVVTTEMHPDVAKCPQGQSCPWLTPQQRRKLSNSMGPHSRLGQPTSSKAHPAGSGDPNLHPSLPASALCSLSQNDGTAGLGTLVPRRCPLRTHVLLSAKPQAHLPLGGGGSSLLFQVSHSCWATPRLS